MQNVQTSFRRMWRLAVLMVLSLLSLAVGAQAQVCSADMNFGDPGSTRYYSTGVAFRGFVAGDVFGRVRSGRLTDFNLTLYPETNGLNGLRRMSIGYNASPAVAVPGFRCTPITGGVRINLTRVPTARQYFQSDSTYSTGFADVEIIFERTGPGRINVRYKHSAFNRADATPPLPFNGIVANAAPQAGKRLHIINR